MARALRRVTNIAELARLARRREGENWRFRDFVKGCGIEPKEIDRIVHELYRQESEKFDCVACANCCKEISPLLDNEDVRRLAVWMDVSSDLLIREYLAWDEEYEGLVFRIPCPMLKDDRCICYHHRPMVCASYPHLHKDGFVRRLSNMVANCSICPVVFNVIERLKDEMKPHGWSRYMYERGRK